MISSYQNIRETLVSFLLRFPAETGPARLRDARLTAEDHYRDAHNKLKRFFEGNEMPVGHAMAVLAVIAERIDKQGVLTDTAGNPVDSLAAFGVLLLDEAGKTLDDVLRAEAAAQDNLMRLLERRAVAHQGGRPGRTPAKSAETVYWEWIGRCENFFTLHHAEPPRALASLVLRRLAGSIGTDGMLRDRNKKEIGNIDAYVDQIARNVIKEHRRQDSAGLTADPDAGGFVEPESDRADDELEEEIAAGCKTECASELERRHLDLCGFVKAYQETCDVRDNAERIRLFIAMARELRATKPVAPTPNGAGDVGKTEKEEVNYLRVNICRMREKLEAIYKECLHLCVEKKS